MPFNIGNWIELGLLCVGAWYGRETYLIRRQNQKNLDKLDEQIEIQRRQNANVFLPVLYLRSTNANSLGNDLFLKKFIAENGTGNPALSVRAFCRVESISRDTQEHTVDISRTGIADMPCIGGRESRLVQQFSTAYPEENTISDIINVYNDDYYSYFRTPVPLFPDTDVVYDYIFLLFKDIAGNTHMTQRAIPYRLDRNGNKLLNNPENPGYEEFFPHVTLDALSQRHIRA